MNPISSLTQPGKTFTLTPTATTQEEQTSQPSAAVNSLLQLVRWDWMLDVSGKLASQLRRLGARSQNQSNAGLLADDPSALTPMTSAHGWMIQMAFRGAMDILEFEESAPLPPHISEITTVASLVGTTNPRNAKHRLTLALRDVAATFTQACHNEGIQAQFVFCRPMSALSPITQQQALPFTVCRVLALNSSETALTAILERALQQSRATTELLVMSSTKS